MNAASLFSSFLSWIVTFALWMPIQLLKLVGMAFPPCTDWGVTALPDYAAQSTTDILRFLWPVLQYVPWTFVWNYVSAWLLFLLFHWLFDNFKPIVSFVAGFWWILVVWFLIGGLINLFVTDYFPLTQSSPLFTEVFGDAPSSTGVSGGGGAGGGGGSW